MSNFLRMAALLTSSLTAFGPPAFAGEPAKFCDRIAALPWHQSMEETKNKLKLEQPVRTLIDSEGDKLAEKEIGAILDLVSPNRLSSELISRLKEFRQSDYSVFSPHFGKTYYFGNVDGSAQCHYDSWGVLLNSEIQAAGDGPDLGDSCGVERYFGQFENEDILVQYASKVVGGTGETPLTTDYAYDEVRVVRTEKAYWNDVCVIKLP